ncbi:hypothetical protein M426DRAFT_23062 [Hypoxylon sp. CI-4A]|nr:hypothetical protein M426DRAFT_23062 [Hypoxylon sp. CI-4A]
MGRKSKPKSKTTIPRIPAIPAGNSSTTPPGQTILLVFIGVLLTEIVKLIVGILRSIASTAIFGTFFQDLYGYLPLVLQFILQLVAIVYFALVGITDLLFYPFPRIAFPLVVIFLLLKGLLWDPKALIRVIFM